MATMQQIEELAAKTAAVRDALTGTFMAQQDEIADIEKKYLPRVRRLTAEFKAASESLMQAVSDSPQLFVRPRSVVFHAIKLGYAKGRGKIEWECADDTLIKRIRANHPDQVGLLIETIERPVKTALADLAATDLRKLGVVVEETGDVPFVRLADTEIAKTIKGLLRSAEEE